MSPPLLIIMIGFLYVLFFGGLSWLRREGLSMRFAIESIIITLLFSGAAYFFGVLIHPALFLILVYLLTARVRLMVDLANTIARHGKYIWAEKIYILTLQLFPDQTNRLIVEVNQGVLYLQRRLYDEAVETFTTILQQKDEGFLGVKNEAACHYNLAVAYQRKNMDVRSYAEFQAVMDILPASIYGQRAAAALQKGEKPHK